MRHYYYIFKTDNLSGKTELVCGGAHKSILDCKNHFRIYCYGFMDCSIELHGKSHMTNGTHGDLSFTLRVDGKKDVEYFMLLDEEGQDLIHAIS